MTRSTEVSLQSTSVESGWLVSTLFISFQFVVQVSLPPLNIHMNKIKICSTWLFTELFKILILNLLPDIITSEGVLPPVTMSAAVTRCPVASAVLFMCGMTESGLLNH